MADSFEQQAVTRGLIRPANPHGDSEQAYGPPERAQNTCRRCALLGVEGIAPAVPWQVL